MKNNLTYTAREVLKQRLYDKSIELENLAENIDRLDLEAINIAIAGIEGGLMLIRSTRWEHKYQDEK